VLPDCLLRFRHYLVGVIQTALAERFERGSPWSGIAARCAEQGTPALCTIQRWCASFVTQVPRWLAVVQETLARQESHSLWLDPHGEAARCSNAAQALLQAAVHLLAWAKTQWAELAGYGWNDRLRFLGVWGAGRGLGRLV
jgi:hypothetical protein